MFSLDGLSANMRQLVAGARHYADKGVYPPIRRDTSSNISQFLDWARPSSLGKLNRLMVRERGGQFFSHNKRAAGSTGASFVAGKAAAVAIVGLSAVSGGSILAGLGALGAVLLVTNALKHAYDKHKHSQAKDTVAVSPTEKARRMIGLLSHGDIQNLARRAEKAVDHEKKFRLEQIRTELQRGFITCVSAIEVTWRYERWFKRVEDSIVNGEEYQNLCQLNVGLQDVCADAAIRLANGGLVIVDYFCKNYDSTQVYTSLVDIIGANLQNEGVFFWPDWFEAAATANSLSPKSIWEAELQNVLLEARAKSGISVGQLTTYAHAVQEGTTSVGEIAAEVALEAPKTALHESLAEAIEGHFLHMVKEIGHGSAKAIGTPGASLGLSALIGIGTEIWNDRGNMKILGSETGGSERSLSDRIFMLMHILEHGRLEHLGESLERLAEELETMSRLVVSVRTMDPSIIDSDPSKEVQELAVAAYKAHKHLLEVLTLSIWVTRLVSEIGNMLIEMVRGQTRGQEGLEESGLMLKGRLNELERRGHENCRGTCYGTEKWHPLNGTDAALARPAGGEEPQRLNRAA